MKQTVEAAPMAAGPPVPSKPAAPPQRLDEVVKLVKMELISGRAAHNERGTGFNPYDKGSASDVWGKRRRA
ncbi:MAG: hypothetical protein WB646_17625 [Steroidobacteraceae bacterium]